MAHRYQLGAQVGFSPGLAHRDAAEGTYEVVRQLPPASDGEHKYCIKSARDHYERRQGERSRTGVSLCAALAPMPLRASDLESMSESCRA
jgi:hypothetical protein